MDYSQSEKRGKRKFLGILFQCCNTYGRIYRREDQPAYTGACPKCGKKIVVPVGENGTNTRFFVAK